MRLFESVFENSGIAIALVEPTGKLFSVNTFFCKYLGYTKEEMLSMTFAEFTHPDDVDADEDLYSELISGKREYYRMEKRYITKSGEIVWADLSVSLIRDDKDNPEYGVGMVKDITEKKVLSQEKEDALKIFRSVFDSTFSFMGLLEKDGTIIEINKTALDFAGYSSDEIKGLKLEEAKWWPTKREKELAKKGVEEALTGQEVRLDLNVIGNEGNILRIDFSIVPIKDSNGDVLFLVPEGRDITERELMNKELIETKERLERAQEIAKIGNWNWDLVEDKIIWSDQNYRVFGQTKDFNPSIDSLNKIIHEEDRGLFQEGVSQAISKNQEFDFIHRIIVEDEEVRYIHQRGKTRYNDEGEPINMAGTSQDVTDSILRELAFETQNKEIQKALDLLSETQRAAKIGSWEVDLGTMTAFWSDEVYRIHELEEGTPIKVEEGINFYREDFRPVIQNAINNAIENKSSWDVECVLLTKSGNEIWVRATGHPFFEDGELTGLRGLFMDIDENKRKTIELDETNEKLQLSVEAGQIAIWIWNLKTNELEWNDKAYEIFGVEESVTPNFEMFSQMVHPSDLEMVIEATSKTLETGERFDVVFRFNKPDGTEIILSGRGDLILDSKGAPAQMIGINLDITERMRLLENIQLKESQLRSFVEQAPAAVAMLDKEMKYITASNEWFKQYNIDKKDLVGISHYDIFPEINEMPEWLEQHQRVLNGEELSNPKDKIVRKDGTVQWISWKLIPWYNEPGEIGGMIMYTADITSEVYYTEKLEKEVAKRTKELASVNEELESFSYSISHDLRAPLRSINGFSDILMEDYADQLDSEGKRLMGVVKESAVTMGQLIDDILEFSRLGKKKIQKSEIDMTKLFESVCEVETGAYSDKQIDLKIDSLPNALGDVALIKQVVVNLVSNAFKYSSKEDKIVINIGFDQSEENEVAYFIKDNGTGFKMEYHDKLFGVFNRLHSKNEFDGTGVGLAIAKRIINKHGGKIWAESAEGKGSIFFFSMPNS